MGIGHYAKFIVALLGGAATATVSVFGADTIVGKVATIVLAAMTAVTVYIVPNTPAAPVELPYGPDTTTVNVNPPPPSAFNRPGLHEMEDHT